MRRIKGTYAKGYYKVLRDPELSATMKIVYMVLLDRSTFENQGWSTQKYSLFEDFGISSRNARRIVNQLHDMGYIIKTRNKYSFKSVPIQFYRDESQETPIYEIAR